VVIVEAGCPVYSARRIDGGGTPTNEGGTRRRGAVERVRVVSGRARVRVFLYGGEKMPGDSQHVRSPTNARTCRTRAAGSDGLPLSSSEANTATPPGVLPGAANGLRSAGLKLRAIARSCRRSPTSRLIRCIVPSKKRRHVLEESSAWRALFTQFSMVTGYVVTSLLGRAAAGQPNLRPPSSQPRGCESEPAAPPRAPSLLHLDLTPQRPFDRLPPTVFSPRLLRAGGVMRTGGRI
jgi:hypothetical protein